MHVLPSRSTPRLLAALLPMSLLLAALLLAARPAAPQQANAAAIRPGLLELELAPHASSSLGVDAEMLASRLCGLAPRALFEATEEPEERGNSAEDCHLVVGGSGGQNRDFPVSIAILAVELQPAGQPVTATVSTAVSTIAFLGGEDFTTTCGRWNFEVTLDPSQRQPETTLLLFEPAGGERVGLVAGTLRAAALLRFRRASDGLQRVLPLALELDAAGRWTVLDPHLAGVGLSTLSLFVDGGEGRYTPRASCMQEAHRCGLLCLEATPERVGGLNGG